MRDFTPEEKELIINTPITNDCFDEVGFWAETFIEGYEKARQIILRYKNLNPKLYEKYVKEFILMLPNSYKVINLAGTPDLEKLTNGMIQRTI